MMIYQHNDKKSSFKIMLINWLKFLAIISVPLGVFLGMLFNSPLAAGFLLPAYTMVFGISVTTGFPILALGFGFGVGLALISAGLSALLDNGISAGYRIAAGFSTAMGAASIGTLIGSLIFPGIGTLFGAVIGLAVGALTSTIIGCIIKPQYIAEQPQVISTENISKSQLKTPYMSSGASKVAFKPSNSGKHFFAPPTYKPLEKHDVIPNSSPDFAPR